ncbi:hypothetical protein ACXR6G_06910 [Ancylomarina sp. YFZ004]
MNYILENKEWIFSGIGVLIISLVISLILYFSKKKKQNKTKGNIRMRNVNQYGEKSQYIEKIDGDININ